MATRRSPAAYVDGLALLRELAEIGHPFRHVGIPAYPQGHAFIADGPLLDALRAKAEFAQYMTTQLCFDPAAISTWLAARRAEGLMLPVHVGVPGVAEPQKLLALAARIGVADTHRFLAKNIRFVARLVRSGGFYRPDALLEGIAPTLADPAANVTGFHLYLFNAVEVTEGWRRAKLASSSGWRDGARDRASRDELLRRSFAPFRESPRPRAPAAARAAGGASGRPSRSSVTSSRSRRRPPGRLRDLATIDEPRWTGPSPVRGRASRTWTGWCRHGSPGSVPRPWR